VCDWKEGSWSLCSFQLNYARHLHFPAALHFDAKMINATSWNAGGSSLGAAERIPAAASLHPLGEKATSGIISQQHIKHTTNCLAWCLRLSLLPPLNMDAAQIIEFSKTFRWPPGGGKFENWPLSS